MGDHRFNKHATDLEARLAAGNPPVVKDRLGRTLQPGDHVILTLPPNPHLFWQVQAIAPNVDPRQPAGTVMVQLMAVFTSPVPRNQPIMELIRVREAVVEAAQVLGLEDAGVDRVEPPLDPPSES